MNVQAIFQSPYDGELSGAVWIIDAVPNRVRFEGTTRLDPSSALFCVGHYETQQAALCGMIWGIQDHYPNCDSISVIGASLTASINTILQDDYKIATTDDGFICTPKTRG